MTDFRTIMESVKTIESLVPVSLLSGGSGIVYGDSIDRLTPENQEKALTAMELAGFRELLLRDVRRWICIDFEFLSLAMQETSRTGEGAVYSKRLQETIRLINSADEQRKPLPNRAICLD